MGENINLRLKTLISASGAAVTLVLLAAPAFAATDIETVVVTAQKREQALIDVPAAITAISDEKLHDLNVTDFASIAQQVPNFTINYQWGNNSTPSFNIRGVEGDGTASRLNESSVAIYTDDVYLGDENMLNGLVFDAQRVEVLRGPQGTLFGRNTTAGLVHFISQTPTDEVSGYGTVLYGEDNTVTLEGAVSGPLTDHVRVRLAGRWDTDDGHYKNYYLGAGSNGIPKQLGAKNIWGLRGIVDADLGPHTLLRFIADFSDDNSVLMPADLVGSLKPGTAPAAFFPAADQCNMKQILMGACEEIAQVIFGGAPHPPRVAGIGSAGLSASQLAAKGQTGIFTAKLTHDFGWAMLTSVANYSYDRYFQGIEAGRSSPTIGADPTFYLPRTNNAHQASEELRLNGSTSAFDWVVGGLYYSDHKYFHQLSSVPLFGIVSVNTATVDSHSYALFGQMDNHLTDTVTLSVGARYTGDTRDLLNAVTSDNFGDFQDVVAYMKAHGFPTESDTRDLTGKIGLAWKPSDDLSTYVSLSRGIKGAGFNAGFTSGNVSNPNPAISGPAQLANAQLAGPVGQETLDSWELGLKSRFFDQTLSMNDALFFYQYSGKQVSVARLDTSTGIATFNFLNVGDAQVWGLETEISFRPDEHWDFSASGAWMGNRITKSSLTVQDTLGNPVALRGLHLPDTPDWTINAIAAYHVPVENLGGFTLQVEENGLAKRNFSLTNDAWSTDPAYFLTNFRIMWHSDDGRFNAQAYVTNAFNKLYAYYINDASNGSLGAITIADSEKRLWGVKVGVNF